MTLSRTPSGLSCRAGYRSQWPSRLQRARRWSTHENGSSILHEQALLLALHDEKGTIHSSMFSYAIAGAVVADLVLRGRLRLEEAGGKKKILVADARPVGAALLDETLRRIDSAKRRATMATWVGRTHKSSGSDCVWPDRSEEPGCRTNCTQ